MTAVTLGDFLETADGHFAAAASALREGIRDRVGAARQVGRLAGLMARYLEAVTRADVITPRGVPDWSLAAVYMRDGARASKGYIDQATGSAAEGLPPADDPVVRHLGLAVDALVVGGDLLWSHIATHPDGSRAPRSDWALILGSEPFALAVADEAVGWAQRAMHVLDHLTGIPRQVQGLTASTLADARGLLSGVAGTHRQAGNADYDMVSRRELLRTLPSLELPGRVRPGPGESDADLCDAIAMSVRRLRAFGFAASRLPGESPLLSRDAWMRTARAAAVISDLACGMTRMLADRSAALGVPVTAEAGLRNASASFDQACAAWRQVAWMWQYVQTDTQTPVSPAIAETNDLVLRLGRLLHGDPGWTPAASRQTARRDPVSLADGRPALIRVLAAVHETADAVTRSARADLDGIKAADAVGRLYMPNRFVESQTTRLPYAILSGYRAHLLLNAYHIGIDASLRAVTALDTAALEAGAPSKGLGLVRTAAAVAGDVLEPEPGYEPDLDTFAARRLKYFKNPARSMLRPHTDLDAEAVIRAYTEAGLSLTECADRFTSSRGAVRNVLLHNGYRPHPRWAGDGPRDAPAPGDPAGTRDEPETSNHDAPVTSVLKEMGVKDYTAYVRAAAIDKAAADLIGRVSTSAAGAGQPHGPKPRPRTAIQLAALDETSTAPGQATPPPEEQGLPKLSGVRDLRYSHGRRPV